MSRHLNCRIPKKKTHPDFFIFVLYAGPTLQTWWIVLTFLSRQIKKKNNNDNNNIVVVETRDRLISQILALFM